MTDAEGKPIISRGSSLHVGERVDTCDEINLGLYLAVALLTALRRRVKSGMDE